MSLSDTTAPTTPQNFRWTAFNKSKITLAWNASTDAVGVAGYRIYRNGVLLVTTTNLNYTANRGNKVYTYYVVAFDAAGNVSVASTSITK